MTDLQPTHVTVTPDGSCTLHVGDRLTYRWHPALRRWQKCVYSPQGRPSSVEWATPDPRHLLKHRDILPMGCMANG